MIEYIAIAFVAGVGILAYNEFVEEPEGFIGAVAVIALAAFIIGS